MAGINVVAAKSALITALDGLTSSTLSGWVVSYSYVGKLHQANRKYLFFDSNSGGPLELSAMKGSARLKREETATAKLCLRLTTPGQETGEANEVAIAAAGAVVENYLAANPTLSVSGLLKATVESFSLITSVLDTEVKSDLDYTIQFDSYLT